MTLLAAWLAITADWRPVFPQVRTWRRAVRQALGSLVCLGRRSLRLFVVAPTPYRKRKSAKLYYRQPAYLLTTDLQSSARSCRSTSTAGRLK